MPQAMIADDLAKGRLVPLQPQDGSALQYPLYLIHRSDDPLGPAGRWLRQQFLELDYCLPHDAF